MISNINSSTSKCIYNMKALAIITVVFAHCPYEGKFNFLKLLYGNLGTVGVPIFFILSGMLYNFEKYTLRQFAENKVKSLVIPWLVCGTGVYLYVAVRKDGIRILNWINFIIGNGSYLYYMSMLMICMIICYLFHSKKACIFLMAASFVNYVCGFIFKIDFINQYLNPLIWVGYFSFGLYVQRYGNINKIFDHLTTLKWSLKWSFVIIFVLLLAVMSCCGKKLSYWDLWHIPFSIIATVAIAAVSTQIKKIVIRELGMYSFTIYLIHMPFVGIINYLFEHMSNQLFLSEVIYIFRPLIVIAASYGFIKLLIKITTNNKLQKLQILIGLR